RCSLARRASIRCCPGSRVGASQPRRRCSALPMTSGEPTRTMTEATSTSTRSRRGILAGTTAALLGIVSFVSGRSAVAGESQDSVLLILCAEFHRAQADLDRWHATGFGLEPLDRETEAYRLWAAEDDRFFWAHYDAFQEVCDMPARTQAGLVAKSKVL